jgi:hypothetical protein
MEIDLPAMESILVESHLVCKDVRQVSSAIVTTSFGSDKTEIRGKDIRHPEPVI